MPIRKTTYKGKPAYQWGKSGAKYQYTPGNKASEEKAKKKAGKQARAIYSSGYKGK